MNQIPFTTCGQPLPYAPLSSMSRSIPSQTKDNGGQALRTIRDAGTLRVGATGDFRPMNFLDPRTNRYEGFDVDLVKVLAGELDVDVRFVPTTWRTLSMDTRHGMFDLACTGVTRTEGRAQSMGLSEGYLDFGKTILCRKEDASRFTRLQDVDDAEVRVMTNPGGTNERFARHMLHDATLYLHEANEEIPSLIAMGLADIMITETVEATAYARMDSRLAAPLLSSPFTQESFGILMPAGSTDLLAYIDDFLGRCRENGTLKRLAAAHDIHL